MEKREAVNLTARQILAANIQALLDRDDPQKKRRGQHGRFAKPKTKIVLSKIQRAVAEGRMNMETLEQFANFFKVEPYQLLIRNLNVKEPQVAIDRKQWARVMQAAKELTEVES